MSLDLRISRAGDVTTFKCDDKETVLWLKQKIADRFHVEDTSTIKLLYKGICRDDQILGDTFKNNARIICLTSKPNANAKLPLVPTESTHHDIHHVKLAPKKPASSNVKKSSTYTFHEIQVLNLPNKDQAWQYMDRLRHDPGIQALMDKYKWSVPILSEMSPAEHTTHESRTMGLNHNHGQQIELRIRTDRYDGFRYYKDVKSTLIHELTHNVHSEHDSDFWTFFKRLTKECDAAESWSRPGQYLGDKPEYTPSGEDPLDEEAVNHRRDILFAAAQRRLEKKE
ncbi:ubiquitin/metalloprotease fusion protein [Schizosaccharomyces japonicus yFS275]|uniref:Ubiquitin/metalloprotease fusion protein n=1 Tax=Schizosaccharomyces japonicus (strain yFS275 / FY16936) TaxID=402676 RepID=B6K2N6_SCHJY|nr:ubiquitin/metalloprotease fusion protein [Schizosaccharomyces japonicus yFS275]EEB07417.1 ubiquitin/metalloprotease fusion protein [Schizosaccharomyces japonicus yFS275]